MKHACKAALLELDQVTLGGVEGVRIHAARLQRLEHAAAAHQRHLALG